MEQSFSIDNIDFAWFQLCCSSHSYLLSVCCLALWFVFICVFGIIICLAPPTLPCFLSQSWDSTAPPITFSEKVHRPAGTTKSLSKRDHKLWTFFCFIVKFKKVKSFLFIFFYIFGFRELFSHGISS